MYDLAVTISKSISCSVDGVDVMSWRHAYEYAGARIVNSWLLKGAFGLELGMDVDAICAVW